MAARQYLHRRSVHGWQEVRLAFARTLVRRPIRFVRACQVFITPPCPCVSVMFLYAATRWTPGIRPTPERWLADISARLATSKKRKRDSDGAAEGDGGAEDAEAEAADDRDDQEAEKEKRRRKWSAIPEIQFFLPAAAAETHSVLSTAERQEKITALGWGQHDVLHYEVPMLDAFPAPVEASSIERLVASLGLGQKIAPAQIKAATQAAKRKAPDPHKQQVNMVLLLAQHRRP